LTLEIADLPEEPDEAGDHPTGASFAGTDHTSRSVEKPLNFVEGSGLRYFSNTSTLRNKLHN